MTQKIIRIGDSAGITIPKKKLNELGLTIGDEVKVTLSPVKKNEQQKLMSEYEAFVAEYGETLKNLADR